MPTATEAARATGPVAADSTTAAVTVDALDVASAVFASAAFEDVFAFFLRFSKPGAGLSRHVQEQ